MSISDGFNVTTLVIELVNIINALETGSECDETQIKLSVPESCESYCKKAQLYREELAKKVEQIAQTPTPKFVFDAKFKSANETGFSLDLVCIDRETSDRVIKLTKKHDMRITSYYQTVAFYALKRLYSENKLNLPLSLPMFLTLSFRYRILEILYKVVKCQT